MTIERLHQEFKFRWNKVNSNHKKDFPSAFIDDAFNKATDDYNIKFGLNKVTPL